MTGATRSQDNRLVNYYRWHSKVYDLTRWAFLFGRAELIQCAVSATPSDPPRRVIEIGCGTGTNLVRLANAFPKAQITGVDLSEDMLQQARRKVAPFGSRVTLFEGAYPEAVAGAPAFDLIVLSYCLTMINPGFAQVLQACTKQLSAKGCIAVADFHDTPWTGFQRWMGVNHVRMDGQILAELKSHGFILKHCSLRAAYGGLWRWMLCLAQQKS